MGNYIFLISLPRSGSTMLQKALNNHPQIKTTSEPWMLLPLLYGDPISNFSINKKCVFNGKSASHAIKHSLLELYDSEILLKSSLIRVYKDLYNTDQNITKYFLDKTPRYYLIIDEIKKYFPHSKIVILLRNPLDILNSILSTWVKNNHHFLAFYKIDLFQGLDCLIEQINVESKSVYFIRYEQLINNPENEIKALTDFLHIEFNKNMLDLSNKTIWKLGDQKNINIKNSIDNLNKHSWLNYLSTKNWKIMKNYLEYIGEDKFNKLGYDFEAAMDSLDSIQPSLLRRIITPSLNYYTSKFSEILLPITTYKRNFLDRIRKNE